MDCDLYSSSKYVLEAYGHRLRPQSIILFDEFFNYAKMDGGWGI